MSGIYIPGVTMPQSCYDNCPCQALHWCNALNADTTDVLMEWRRLDGCPLVPVPEHGRLIDADAFSAKITEIVERQKYDDFYAQSLSVGAILREVVNELRGEGLDGFANAPTIIPADVEVDNGN